MEKQLITSIQRFSAHDGPGLRTVVFFSGCPMRCAWCHNPKTQSGVCELMFEQKLCINCGLCAEVCPKGAHLFENAAHTILRDKCRRCMKCAEVCPTGALTRSANEFTAREIMKTVLRDQPFYGSAGGITLSGGEPLLNASFAAELLKASKKAGISTCIETCGYVGQETFETIAPYTDLLLFDIKDTFNERHRKFTGADNVKIHGNLLFADSLGIPSVMRCIIVKGINDNKDNYDGIASLFLKLRNCKYVQLLPYHTYGSSKSVQLGRERDARNEWIPTKNDITIAAQYLKDLSVNIIL